MKVLSTFVMASLTLVSATAFAQQPTDAQIASIVVTANQVDMGLSGAAFDKAYIANEVAYHQQVLDAVDKVLIPSAKNDELKALLVKVRPAFVSHLEQAKRVQASLH